ncbi:EF-hand calcium-binding domain-containing protein 7-like [Lineus longissimus]|uniref:EF-hand calcium-binding domain-containing protein 7-like n=1 Tax=Lineus longissimus TaxID=88925 RepID=UPI00315CC58A
MSGKNDEIADTPRFMQKTRSSSAMSDAAKRKKEAPKAAPAPVKRPGMAPRTTTPKIKVTDTSKQKGAKAAPASAKRPASTKKTEQQKQQEEDILMTLSEEDLLEMQQVFVLYDKDGDGTISTKELGDMFRYLGQTTSDAELDDIIRDADTDGDGELDFVEFVTMMMKRMSNQSEAELREAFKVFDKDDKGYLTHDELRAAMTTRGTPMTEEEVNEMIAEADVDGDGNIDYKGCEQQCTLALEKMSRPASKPGSEGGGKSSRSSTAANPAKKTPTPNKSTQPPKLQATGPPGSYAPSTRTPTTASGSRASNKSKVSVKIPKKRGNLESVELQLLRPEEVRLLRKAFALYDKDGDGTVSTRELKTILRAIGYSPSEAELQDMIHEQDPDGDGYLTFHDFAHLIAQRKNSENTEEELLAAFRVFDRDRDGHISSEELRTVMRKMGDVMTEEEIEDMITEIDVNGDGEIDYNEFLEMMLFE